MTNREKASIGETLNGATGEIDYSNPSADDYEALSRDRMPIRSMTVNDLDAIVAIDRVVTGRDRTTFYERLFEQTFAQSALRIALVAEQDDRPVGFIMARVDYGEFGRTEPAAVMDTIGVDPDYAEHGVGTALMSQLMANLGALRTDHVRTVVNWDSFDLLRFLAHCGFRPSQRLAFRRTVD